MNTVEDRMDLERQLQGLRVGLKVVCGLVSFLLLLPTWFAFAQFARTREMVMEMGAPALPLIARFTMFLLDFQVPLLLLSFGCFIAVLISSLRSRGGVFLWVFAGQLLLQGVLMTVLFLSSLLVTSHVIRSIMV